MSQDINFLPLKYRQVRQSRRKKVWRRSVLIAFLALISAGVVGQRQMRSRLVLARDNLRSNADRMASQLEDPQRLRDEVARLDGHANVLAFLRVRVPPTRILSAVTNALPRFVTLTDLSIKSEPLPAPAAGRQVVPPANPAQLATVSPAEKDLAALKKERDENSLFVTISGIAPHDIAIAGYLAALQRTGVFAEVVLLYTDQQLIEECHLRRFGARLKVNKPEGSRS